MATEPVTECTPVLLVTANVGSVFEDPSKLLQIWIDEFLGHVATRNPTFIALHLQEVGGKTYEKSMEYVQEFIKNLCESSELREYDRIRVYLDEDYNSAEHFTALGNLYFAKGTIETLAIWNFLTHEWDTVDGKSIHTGNIETVASKEKAKFPQHFFPECKWSRKGFLRTRWSLNGTVFDLVNIHLFHDASNLAACEEYPSVYCKSRRRALVHTLERFHKDANNPVVPYFVFGDFNFRCDTEGVIKKLTEDLTEHRINNAKNGSTVVQYRDAVGANVLTVGKKEFYHSDQRTFKDSWLRQFDRELDALRAVLYEFPVTFAPSYPFEEDPLQPGDYMATRCPAWCDRILISPVARKLIDEGRGPSAVTYGIIGERVCMGDHKPVYLSLNIQQSNQGTVINCSCDTHASSVFSCSNASFCSVLYGGTATTDELDADTSIVEPTVCCKPYIERTLAELSKILAESDSIGTPKRRHSGSAIPGDIPRQDSSGHHLPPISINVFDTDSNLNVCMCAMYSSTGAFEAPNPNASNQSTPMFGSLQALDSPQICPNCRNMIKHQPTEHRKTLVSRRMMLANNIIVNRIDAHYLSTFTAASASGQQNGSQFEPYTPESAESHSPIPEASNDSNSTPLSRTDGRANYGGDTVGSSGASPAVNLLDTVRDATTNNSELSGCGGGVSPRQLMSRLEKLKSLVDRQRSSTNHAKRQPAHDGTRPSSQRLSNNLVHEHAGVEDGNVAGAGDGDCRLSRHRSNHSGMSDRQQQQQQQRGDACVGTSDERLLKDSLYVDASSNSHQRQPVHRDRVTGCCGTICVIL